MRLTKRQKALAYIEQDRVTVLRASKQGIRVEVRGSKREPYIVRLGREGDYLVTECSCDNGTLYHPVRPTCAHMEIARLLWRE